MTWTTAWPSRLATRACRRPGTTAQVSFRYSSGSSRHYTEPIQLSHVVANYTLNDQRLATGKREPFLVANRHESRTGSAIVSFDASRYPATTLGQYIRRKQLGQNLKGVELAERLGVNEMGTVNWEKDKMRPRAKMLRKMCEVLELQIAEVVGLASCQTPKAYNSAACWSCCPRRVVRVTFRTLDKHSRILEKDTLTIFGNVGQFDRGAELRPAFSLCSGRFQSFVVALPFNTRLNQLLSHFAEGLCQDADLVR